MPSPTPPRLTDVVLAVHGIGDQTRNSTVLSTLIRFCDHFQFPGTVALGAFHDALTQADPTQPPCPALSLRAPPTCAGLTECMGFAEIHWAHLAREISEDGYVLQETKAWARSVVNRVRVMAAQSQGQLSTGIDYPRIRQVLEEMIDAIGVLESLLFLARKAGILEFDLKKLLEAYLGDVQIVAEFAGLRRKILAQLHETLRCAHRCHPDARIHLVAHSEGTVIAWLGLLEAAGDPVQYPWIQSVRSFMTIGSPIDKHLILWPELFSSFKGPVYRPAPGNPRIRWLNYVDRGDPVGYELDTARAWMRDHGYDQVFQFRAKDDFVFSRYYFPGKAHNDYWTDPAVFSHFISHAVLPVPERPPAPEPRSHGWAQVCNYAVAYVLPFAVLWLAAYVLYQGLNHYLYPDAGHEAPDAPNLLWALTLCVVLLAGTTVWLRLEELTRSAGWRTLGVAIYLASAGLFWWGLRSSADLSSDVFSWFNALPSALTPGWSVPASLLAASLGLVALTLAVRQLAQFARWLGRALRDGVRTLQARLGAEPSLGFAAGSASLPRPATPGRAKPAVAVSPQAASRLKTMIAVGAALMLLTVALNVFRAEPRGSLWPLLLAGFGFLYLWRLSALLFDLSFVWHRYVRGGVALEYLRQARFSAAERERQKAADRESNRQPAEPVSAATSLE